MQQEIMGEIRNAMPEEIFETETGLPMAAALFKNNTIACLVSVVTGFVPFLFLPAISLCMNAAILGLLGGVYQVNDMSVVGMYVFGILPHGIFEFPALLLSMAMGLRICYCLVKRICEGKYNRGAVKTAVAGSLRTFLLVVTPLLLFAAIIEATLTPFLMGQFMGL
jgi:stage II sporulation protein M